MEKRQLERSVILAAYRDADGNIARTAELLKVSRRTLQDRMRELGMERGRAGRKRRTLTYASGGRGVTRKRRGWIAAGVAVMGLAAGVALGARKHRGA